MTTIAPNKILIVDDQPEIRRLLAISLRRECEIVEAADGVAALEVVRLHRPVLVLLDVMLPGDLDGLRVLDAIKGNPQTARTLVAMLTACGQVADQEEARARGADAYFTKPFSPLAVLSWVRAALDRSDAPTDFSQL